MSNTNTKSENQRSHRINNLLDDFQELVEIAQVDDGKQPAGEWNLVSQMAESLADLRDAFDNQESKLTEVSARSDALANAQAEAIVRSAEIIDELETTKKHLSEAKIAAETAANETQRLADTIFERTNDGVFVFQGPVCIACNDNATRLLRCSRSEIVGHWPSAFRAAEFADGSDAASDLQECYSNLNREKPTSVETLLRVEDGTPFWAEITMSAFDMKGAGHALIVIRDITARKRFETELRRHRDFLDNIINAVPDQLSVKSTDKTLVVANDAFCGAHNIKRENAIGQDGSRFDPPSMQNTADLIATGQCENTIHELILNGEPRVHSVNRSSFVDGAGDRYIVATSRDITEDRLRENRLRLLASVFNNASEGVAILAKHGWISEANPAFARMNSIEQTSLIGKKLTEVLSFEDGVFSAALADVADGRSWSGKARSCGDCNDNRSYWVSLSQSMDSDKQSNRVVALVSDITELEDTQKQLRRQAHFDNLTGLPNRRYFRGQLQRLVDQANCSVSVCFLDLDDFKNVNDTAGHTAGDFLLQKVAERIKAVVGEEAFVSRFGGDEFAIIMVNEDSVEILNTLEKLVCAFREPFQLDETEATVGLSIGVTRFPDQGGDIETLMSNADIAMYAAKADGKSRLRIFTSEMQQQVNVRNRVQSRLRGALSNGELLVHFQPKVCAKTRQPKGCEALARWRREDGQFIPPSDFIPIAEQTGLIIPLGETVFQMAAEFACERAQTGWDPDVAVNVSPHQIRHPQFIDRLKMILKDTGALATWFELEITENVMLDDIEHAMSVIQNLSHLGFRIAIDDFGTGYSSLTYIKKFDIDTLKVDMSFVRDVTEDDSSKAVVKSIVSLGQGLGLTVVAEGVETNEQADTLTEIGCTSLQGYALGMPMSPSDYTLWLDKAAAADTVDTGSHNQKPS